MIVIVITDIAVKFIDKMVSHCLIFIIIISLSLSLCDHGYKNTGAKFFSKWPEILSTSRESR